MTKNEEKAIEILKNTRQAWCRILSRYIDKQQKEIEREEQYTDFYKDLCNKQQNEIKKYKRYFKLAISDLQSEGYMQMPYKNIEKYYSKREDIV